MSTVLDYYKNCLKCWSGFDPESITSAQLYEVFVNNKKPFWIRSAEFYYSNINRLTADQKMWPLDDDYLRKYILPKMPTSGRNYISQQEIRDNWRNSEWWYKNFRDLMTMLDNMYVKKSIKESFVNGYGYGPYYNWLTRLIQYLNTFEAELKLAKKLGLVLDEQNHCYLHSGIANQYESLPDFSLSNGDTCELKVCSEKAFNNYKLSLKNNFEYTKQYDFHKATGAIFLLKTVPLKLFSVKLVENLVDADYHDITNRYDLSDIYLMLSDDNGYIPEAALPAIPKSFMFGFKAEWLK